MWYVTYKKVYITLFFIKGLKYMGTLKNKNQLNVKNYNTTYKKYFLLFTGVFAALALIIFSAFIIGGKSFVWNSDGMKQHYVALAYLGRWCRELFRNIFVEHTFSLPMWDFSLGYGSDVLTTLHYYGFSDPLCLLSAFVPSKYTEYLYDFLVILRLYLSGLSYMYFCRHFKKDGFSSVVGAVIYTFSGYAVYAGVRHPFFLVPMMYFPIVLVGAEKILSKESPVIFSVSITLLTFCNFYFSYMVILLAAIYIVVRFLNQKHEKFWRELFSSAVKIFAFGALGLMLAAAVLLPIVLTYLNNDRSGVAHNVTLLYSPQYYKRMFIGFVRYASAGSWNRQGFSVLSLLGVFFMFMKKKKYTLEKIFFAIMIVIQCFPVFAYVFSGFTYVNNRYIWSYAFVLAFIATSTFKDLLSASSKEKFALCVLVGIYAAISFALNFEDDKLVLWQYIVLAAMLCIIAGGKAVFSIKGKNLVPAAVAVLCAASVLLNGLYLFRGGEDSYISKFIDSSKVYTKQTSDASFAFNSYLTDDENFARYEKQKSKTLNQSALSNTNGVSYYWSFSGDYVASFIRNLQVNTKTTYSYYDLNHRSFLDALASVRYYISWSSDSVPYGYEYKESVDYNGKTYKLYENESALPLGYTYDSYITQDEFESLSSTEKQEAMMQSVVLENGADGIENGSYEITGKEVKCCINPSQNVVKSENGFYVKKANSTVTIKFDGLEDSETYLLISNVHAKSMTKKQMEKAIKGKNDVSESLTDKLCLDSKNSKFEIDVSSAKSKNEILVATPSFNFYSGIHDFTINLGYSKKAQNYAVLKFDNAGYYSYDDIKIVCQPMSNTESYIEKLSQNVLENIEIKDNGFSGNISLDESKILCLSAPYSSGWTAYVDSEKAELLRTNIWSMGIVLGEGDHQIELKYETPGFKAGLAVSIVSLCALCAVIVYYRKREKSVAK